MIHAIDLFCGAGGTSTGLALATGGDYKLTAINHWDVAVETHARNHPKAEHPCKGIDTLDPRKVHKGKLDLLLASPECTHHSIARGGKPMQDQSRASAWEVVRWAEALLPREIIVENVKEFETWGPLDSKAMRPLPSRKGETFRAWINAIKSLGYQVDYKVLNSADFGAATAGAISMVQPFMAPMNRLQDQPFSSAEPMNTITATSNDYGFVQPFVMPLNHGGKDFRSHDPASPLPTITGVDAWGKVSPMLVEYYGTGEARQVTMPCPTIVTRDRFGLVEFGYDILFRMLQPHELAAAMGFPADYSFAGTRDQRVKQIGNAVEVNQARALIAAAFERQGSIAA